jgi:hypothetical protein
VVEANLVVSVQVPNYHGPMPSPYLSCEPWYIHNMFFSVFHSATAHCGHFDPFVAIWSFQYVSLYSLIVGPTCEAMKDIFGFVLTNRDKKSSMLCPSIIIFGCRRDVNRMDCQNFIKTQ